MSKKSLKRGLALGSLMAFVITGSAWAAEPPIVTDGDPIKIENGTYEGAKQKQEVSKNTIYKNVDFYNMSFTSGAEKAIIHKGGTLTIDGCNLSNINKTSIDGKHTYGSVLDSSNASAGEVKISNSTISDNTNLKGKLSYPLDKNNKGDKRYAVIYISNKSAYIENSVFKNNIANHKGGALFYSASGKKLTISESNFENNKSETDKGGAISVSTCTVDVIGNGENGNIFKGNTAASWGGAINSEGGTTINLSGANTFKSNTVTNSGPWDKSEGGGGAIGLEYNANGGDILNIEGITIFDGNSAYRGGAIFSSSVSKVNFEDVTATFTNNSAKKEGGALYNEGEVNFNNGVTVIFSGNTANGIANDIYNAGIININQGAKVTLDGGITGSGTTNINDGNLVLKGGVTNIATLGGVGGIIRFESADAKLEVNTSNNETLRFTATSDVNAAVDGDANKLIYNVDWAKDTTMVMEAGDIVGEVIAELGENKDTGKLIVKSKTEAPNPANQSISDAGISLKLHWRTHMNDMNKRMGELRNADGEHGVWTRMVRGESEYENVKAQYNQYQLGYDEKLSVDKRWTVGAAVTFAEGDANYGYGSTDDKSTAFAMYGTKLNDDGTFVDLIARYAHLESDYEDVMSGKGDYSTNGMSVSAEFGKRIQQGNGLWIEPQVELTYGTIDSAEFQLDRKTVYVGDMDSLIGRVGFSLGKDVKQGNVYARASYLYDFDGETVNAFSNGTQTRYFKEDLGGGWWEVGVGANINLSKATYIYADVEKTFGGEVDTNWQWNLGVRYSF